MYSSIEEQGRPKVVEKCYWPLLSIAERDFPIGLEAPGLTLEIINEIDSAWVEVLSKYINEGKIEFIGSGYSQIIGPLVPAKVNNWNQKIGLEIYEQLLGFRPKIALVNEMAYSAGIVEHYIKSGDEAIVMEWNNPRKSHPEWENEWRYFPQKAIGADGRSIPVIWADSIAFQKFQRYAHGEIDLDEYVQYIKSHTGDDDRYFPLYSNDVEIFNFRPERYHTEESLENHSEWERIIELYHYLNQQDWCDFVFPSEVLNGLDHPHGGHELQLESAAQPIPVKKQEKYNINRWALTGRDDLGINTKCYQIYDAFIKDGNDNPEDWKELCYLWSSDFRTHITEKRWEEYVTRLIDFRDKWSNKTAIKSTEPLDINGQFSVLDQINHVIIENESLKILLNKNKGLTIKEFVLKKLSDMPLLGTLDHGYYDDISLGADYYSGHAIIERPGEHKVTDLGKVEPEIFQTNEYVSWTSQQNWGDYTFQNKIVIYSETVVLEKKIESKLDQKAIIRPINFTFNPEAWDRESLYIETHNGGNTIEKFYLKGQFIAHGDIYSSLISARHGFGNTEGIFIVGDNDKSLTFECNMSVSALIPSIIYKEMDGTYFFRLQYSSRETDETCLFNNAIHNISCSIDISPT